MITLLGVSTSFAASNDPYVFNPVSFTHNDPIDIYDTHWKNVTFGDKPAIEPNDNRITNNVRYGSYLRNVDEKQYFRISRLQMSGTVSLSFVNIFADSGVKFDVYDHTAQNIIANQDGKINDNFFVDFNKTSIGGQNFYYINFQRTTNSNETKVYFEFYTDESTPQHYSFWNGEPLVAESYAKMDVSQQIVKQRNGGNKSTAVSRSLTSIPGVSWMKSITYIPYSQSGTNVSNIKHIVIPPGGTREYSMDNYSTFNLSTLRPIAYGTYKHQMSAYMGFDSSSSYYNNSDCYIQYYYPYGSVNAPPVTPNPNLILSVDNENKMVSGFASGVSYQYFSLTTKSWVNISLNESNQWDVSSLLTNNKQTLYIKSGISYATPVDLPSN